MSDQPTSKIRHTERRLGDPIAPAASEQELPEVHMSDDAGSGEKKEIRALGMKSASSLHEDAWSRTPNTTGHGAIHVRSFHCKVTEDGLAFMDQQVNEWLDAHPQYEVKAVQTVLGTFTGKIKEPHVICQVWV